MYHKTVEDLVPDETFLMAGGHYKIIRIQELNGNMMRVYFRHVNHSFKEDYSLDMRYDALFITH